MPALLRTLLLSLALASAAVSAHAIGYSKPAQQVLTRARAATGGAGWNMLRGWHETGLLDGVRYESWADTLRYGVRVETREPAGLRPAGLRVHGFNGAADWQILPGGVTTGADDRAAMAQARTAAFFNGYGFFFPGRFDARGELVGVRQHEGRAFDVVRVQPWGGEPRELWFDRRSHLLTRIVDPTRPQAPAIRVADYRRVGPVLVAFRFSPEDGGAPVRQLDSLTFTPADRTQFSLPWATVHAGKAEPPPPVTAPKPAAGRHGHGRRR